MCFPCAPRTQGHGDRGADDACRKEFSYACNMRGVSQLIPGGDTGTSLAGPVTDERQPGSVLGGSVGCHLLQFVQDG